MSMRCPDKRPDNSRSMIYVMFRKYGLLGSLQLIWSDILPDLLNGIDTARPMPVQCGSDALPIEGRNRYVPSTYSVIASCLAYVSQHIDLSQCNFVDYGSGKGKALIAASKEPFKAILGLEVHPELHAVACRNLRKTNCDARVQSSLQDASEYLPGKLDIVLYFFNPFTGAALEQCLDSIAKSSAGTTRYIIYVNPTEDQVFSQFFDKMEEVNFEPGAVEVNFYKTQ